MEGIDEVEPAGRISGIAVEDIMWAVGISIVVLGLTPLVAVYVLLIA
ncbi:MAG: hypothetical protein NTAFB05_05930 [Nitrobacter sp.]